MVANPAKVKDVARPLGRTEREVVVLSALVIGTERAHLVDQTAADREEMGHVVLGAQQVRTPVWLEKGLLVPAVMQLVLVAVEHVGVRVTPQRPRVPEEHVGLQSVVVVQEAHEVAGGCIDPLVRVADDAQVPGKVDHPDARIPLCERGDRVAQGMVIRRRVDED